MPSCAARRLRRARGRRLRDRPSAAARRGDARRSRDVPLLPRLLGGTRFAGQPLAAADGQKNYDSGIGDSVYYGDCVHRKGIFGGGNCLLPLQVTTVIYGLHSNVDARPAAQHGDPRGPGRRLRRRALDRALQRAHWRSTSSPTPSPTLTGRRWNCVRSTRPAQPPGSCRPRLLPGPVRRDERGAEPRDGKPAGARLPARGRRRSRSQAPVWAPPERLAGCGPATPSRRLVGQEPAAPTGPGFSGLPISRRRLRNASEPINAGIHSEIAR